MEVVSECMTRSEDKEAKESPLLSNRVNELLVRNTSGTYVHFVHGGKWR